MPERWYYGKHVISMIYKIVLETELIIELIGLGFNYMLIHRGCH